MHRKKLDTSCVLLAPSIGLLAVTMPFVRNPRGKEYQCQHFIKNGWLADPMFVDDCILILFHRNAGGGGVSSLLLSSFNPAQVLKENSANLLRRIPAQGTRVPSICHVDLPHCRNHRDVPATDLHAKSGLGLFARSNIGIEDTGCVRLHHPEPRGVVQKFHKPIGGSE